MMFDKIWTAEKGLSLLALAAAFLLTALATPIARRIALLCDCIDRPDGKRKLHTDAVPYFGGLAILAGFSVAAFVFSRITLGEIPRTIWVTVLGGMAICFFGLLDDIYDMPPLLKLALQTVVAVFAAACGGTIDHIGFFGHTLRFGIFAVPVTALWIVLIIYAANLMDSRAASRRSKHLRFS